MSAEQFITSDERELYHKVKNFHEQFDNSKKGEALELFRNFRSDVFFEVTGLFQRMFEHLDAIENPTVSKPPVKRIEPLPEKAYVEDLFTKTREIIAFCNEHIGGE